MPKISNNTILREILTELKELKAILHRPLSNYAIGEEKREEKSELMKCHECETDIIAKNGIIEVDTFYCLTC